MEYAAKEGRVIVEITFSIILPVYNVYHYLDRCMSSVLGQRGEDYEVLLVDDGSTDGSSALCDAWAEKNPRIHVIHKPNGGLASARNAGLAAASGKYVLMFDSDDYIEPDTLDVLRAAIQDTSAEIIRFDLVVHRGGRLEEHRTKLPAGLYDAAAVKEQLLDAALLHASSYWLSACTHAYRMDFLRENKLRFVSEREVLSEDYLFNISALLCAESVYITNRVLYHYDMRRGSLSNSAKPRMMERYTALYEHQKAFFQAHNASETLMRKLNTYYAYSLVYCCCISTEYSAFNGNSWSEARSHVREMLKNKSLKESVRNMDWSALTFKEKVKVWFVRIGFEPGLCFAFRKFKKG